MLARVFFALLVALGGPTVAESHRNVPPMAAVGVLERDGRTDCSAILVAPAMVLTAAHCVAGKELISEGGTSEIYFRTGAYPGHPSVIRLATGRMLHPMYLAGRSAPMHPTGADIALLALDAPIARDEAMPLVPGNLTEEGERLLVASYPSGQGLRARERQCPVAEATGVVAWLSCKVVPGESGGAAVRLGENGPELAGVVVATMKSDGRPYAIVVQTGARLRQLYAVYGLPTP